MARPLHCSWPGSVMAATSPKAAIGLGHYDRIGRQDPELHHSSEYDYRAARPKRWGLNRTGVIRLGGTGSLPRMGLRVFEAASHTAANTGLRLG